MSIELTLLLLVLLMCFLKITLDPSWLNKLIAFVVTFLVLPVFLSELGRQGVVTIDPSSFIVVSILTGVAMMTSFTHLFLKVKNINTSKIED